MWEGVCRLAWLDRVFWHFVLCMWEWLCEKVYAGWRDWIVYLDTLCFVCESDYVRRCMQVGVTGSCIWTRCALYVRVIMWEGVCRLAWLDRVFWHFVLCMWECLVIMCLYSRVHTWMLQVRRDRFFCLVTYGFCVLSVYLCVRACLCHHMLIRSFINTKGYVCE